MNLSSHYNEAYQIEVVPSNDAQQYVFNYRYQFVYINIVSQYRITKRYEYDLKNYKLYNTFVAKDIKNVFIYIYYYKQENKTNNINILINNNLTLHLEKQINSRHIIIFDNFKFHTIVLSLSGSFFSFKYKFKKSKIETLISMYF